MKNVKKFGVGKLLIIHCHIGSDRLHIGAAVVVHNQGAIGHSLVNLVN